MTATTIQAGGGGLSGAILSRGDLLSQITVNGGTSGLIAAQGNLGQVFTYPSGQQVPWS